jgi:hypothetical protein
MEIERNLLECAPGMVRKAHLAFARIPAGKLKPTNLLVNPRIGRKVAASQLFTQLRRTLDKEAAKTPNPRVGGELCPPRNGSLSIGRRCQRKRGEKEAMKEADKIGA